MVAAGQLVRASHVGGLVGTPGESSAAGAAAIDGNYVDYGGGMSTSFTAVALHYYEVICFVPRVDCSTTGLVGGIAIRDGNNTVLEEAISAESFTAALTMPVPAVIYLATFTPGTVTVKASTRIVSGAGTVTPQPSIVGSVQKCRIYATDKGIPN